MNRPKIILLLFSMMLGKKKKEIYPKTGSTSHKFVDFSLLKQHYFIFIFLF
jgi:hypothetical protein